MSNVSAAQAWADFQRAHAQTRAVNRPFDDCLVRQKWDAWQAAMAAESAQTQHVATAVILPFAKRRVRA
jgi:hypothetical protein